MNQHSNIKAAIGYDESIPDRQTAWRCDKSGAFIAKAVNVVGITGVRIKRESLRLDKLGSLFRSDVHG